MYRILTASKDTYITNKIINNSFRATDANLGSAGTLDLFKLYDENNRLRNKTYRTKSFINKIPNIRDCKNGYRRCLRHYW